MTQHIVFSISLSCNFCQGVTNCIMLTHSMDFVISHIYWEGNKCADCLANVGLNFVGFSWWDEALYFLRQTYVRDRIRLPNYRFC